MKLGGISQNLRSLASRGKSGPERSEQPQPAAGRAPGEQAPIHGRKSAKLAALRSLLKRGPGAEAGAGPDRTRSMVYRLENLPGFIERGAALARLWTPSAITHVMGLAQPADDSILIESRMKVLEKLARQQSTRSKRSGAATAPLRSTTTNLQALAALPANFPELPDDIRALCREAGEILALPIGLPHEQRPGPITVQQLGDPDTFIHRRAPAPGEPGSEHWAPGPSFMPSGFAPQETANLQAALNRIVELGNRSASVFRAHFPDEPLLATKCQPAPAAKPGTMDRIRHMLRRPAGTARSKISDQPPRLPELRDLLTPPAGADRAPPMMRGAGDPP